MITCEESKKILEVEWAIRAKRQAFASKSHRHHHPTKPELKNRRLPRNLSLGWIQTAHMYGIAYLMVCYSLEVCGLRKEMVIEII